MSDNPNQPSHRLRIKPNDIYADMDFSILLSRSLDVLGYNQGMIRHRQDFWKLRETLDNIHHVDNFITMYAGSQTEGGVAFYASDIDLMGVYKTVISADNILPFVEYRNLTLFQTDSRDTEAGYTKLKLIEIGNADTDIAESLFESDCNTTYISSEFFTNRIMVIAKRLNTTNIPKNAKFKKSGPAIPLYALSRPDVVNDMVYCFKCYCPFMLQSWIRRPRQYNWPSRSILYDVSQMEAHVVPVGCKGSDTYYQEWRICFTKAEIHLIHSLNGIQIKMYVFLKTVAKTILKKICPEITSYIIKNIVLWMCESLPSELFSEHQLVNRIFQAFTFLKEGVAQNYLPSYMIPERNLFYVRIERGQKYKLIESLSLFIEEGPASLFYRLDKICGAMSLLYQEPQKAELYMIKRNTVEKLYLLKRLRGQIIVPSDMTKEESEQVALQDELYRNLVRALYNLILPNWREVENAQDIYENRLRTFLS